MTLDALTSPVSAVSLFAVSEQMASPSHIKGMSLVLSVLVSVVRAVVGSFIDLLPAIVLESAKAIMVSLVVHFIARKFIDRTRRADSDALGSPLAIFRMSRVDLAVIVAAGVAKGAIGVLVAGLSPIVVEIAVDVAALWVEDVLRSQLDRP